jgi:broad specificity phosphatase PhoE
MKLFLVRHGETEENLAGLLMGQDHGVLTEKGKAQAKETALKLKEYTFAHIFSSDLNRCVDTSLFIKEFHPETPLTFTPELRERHLGVFQGKHHTSVDWESLPGAEDDKKPEGGESVSELKTRVLDFVKKLYDQYPDETILCVSHNAWIKQIVAHYMNTRSLELPKINNAQVIEVEVEDNLGGRIVNM